MRSLSVVVLLASVACTAPSSGGRDVSDPNGPGPLPTDPAVTRVIVEVDHEPDAVPYTGGGLGGDPWDLFDVNAEALFAGSGVTVTAPHTLSEMGELPDLDEAGFPVSRILELSAAHHDTSSSATTSVVHVLWLDGRLEVDGEIEDQVIGVSIGTTGVIAMFKPVVEQLGLLELTRRFGEQATLIHEFGHAIGLVDNGVDALTDHVDSEHGAHCTDDSCVMYWTNEGAGDMADFVSRYISTGSEVLFDDDCLDDMAAALDANP